MVHLTQFFKIYPNRYAKSASRFCEEIWTRNPAELLSTRTKAILFERFYVFPARIFHKIHAQLRFLG